ncbi:MAG: VOC family protein [Microthrixaceae bacterium]
MFDYQRIFHVGVRVHDLKEGMDSIGDSLGLRWAQVIERQQDSWTPEGGASTSTLRFTYSTEGPQHVELLQGDQGSLWDAGDSFGPGLHHSGIFVDSVAETTEALVADGWTLLGAAKSPEDGYGVFSYVRSPTGFLVEPVDESRRSQLEAWWAGGAL